MIFRWMARDFRNNGRLIFLLVLNLSLGLLGLIGIESVKQAIRDSIVESSKSFLTADVSISARKPLTSEQRSKVSMAISSDSQMVDTRNLYSMAAFEKVSRLVQVRQIDEGYPFYGTLKTDSRGEVDAEKLKELIRDQSSVWVYPEILSQLGVKVGDLIRVGNDSFKITEVVRRDAGAALSFSGMAPRIYMGPQALKRANILADKGSTVWYEYLIKHHAGSSPELISELRKTVDDSAVRIMSHETATERSARPLAYLNDYLGLVSLVALFLSFLGCVFLMRSFWQSQLSSFAIYRSLGMKQKDLFGLLSLESISIGAFSGLLAFVVSLLLLPILSQAMKEFLPFVLDVRPSIKLLFLAVGLGGGICFLVVLPVILRVVNIRVGQLFSENRQTEIHFEKRSLLWWAPALIATWGMAVWQVFSYKIGSLFFVSLVALSLILGAGLFFILRGLSRIQWKNFSTRTVIRQMDRQPFSTLLGLISLSLGVLLVCFLQIVKGNLENEIVIGENQALPNLFFMDIQPDQQQPLADLLKSKGYALDVPSPFIRARLSKINGQEFSERFIGENFSSREEERSAEFQNREFNLSFREKMLPSETLVEGKVFEGPFDPNTQKKPYVSVEREFADRVGWKVGDQLEFDVQGVPVEAEVLNIRTVRWTSFEPNFFIQFQPGVLEAAPQTFIAVVRGLTRNQSDELQNLVVAKFGNISMIDVAQSLERVVGIVNQVSWAMRAMAALALLVGLAVFYAILRYQLESRRKDVRLLRLVGVSLQQLRRMIRSELVIFGVLASVGGAVLSIVFSRIVHAQVFQVPWKPDLNWPIYLIVGSVGICWILALIFEKKVITQKE